MVDKKDIKSVNKSDEIRKLAAAMKERGEKPRPVVIVATLKKQGVVVSSPQVSMVLKRMGLPGRRRQAAGGVVAAKGGAISVDDLLAAKKLASHFGGTARALAALEALQRFES